ncbi:MAG: asparagine synthase-related protein [Deltaproteobacteria bacterium]
MAHSIEGRVPFLDLEMIRLGQLIPAEMKLSGEQGIEKWILREAFKDLLPPEILWRDKEQFDEGSGTVDLLAQTLEGPMSQAEAGDYMQRHPESALRSPEECFYHKLFMEVFEKPAAILSNVGRWADRPAWVA